MAERPWKFESSRPHQNKGRAGLNGSLPTVARGLFTANPYSLAVVGPACARWVGGDARIEPSRITVLSGVMTK